MSASPDTLKLTPEFIQALDLLETTHANAFISGKAGTGKSTFLDHFRTHTHKKIAVVAPTGVAALHVKGQTIHSFFNIKPGLIDPGTFKPHKNKKLLGALDLLIIDEISMVRADLFTAIDLTLRHNNKTHLPFGGVQICVIGDLFQLPPVVSRAEEEAYSTLYPSPYFFSSPSFEDADFTVIRFDTVFRQDNRDFVNMLNRLRVGHNGPDILTYLNRRNVPATELGDDGTVVLTTTNAIADQVNESALAALSGQPRTYTGTLTGKFEKDETRLPSPLELVLKVGAQVMFTRNDMPRRRWVNGTIGTVSALAEDHVAVDVKTPLGRTRTHLIEPERWVNMAYGVDEKGNITQTEVGSFTQYPLMLSWAVTIHKSQGKTLDKVVLDLGKGAFSPGQLYVALSRCRDIEKLVLRQPIRPRDVKCDPRIMAFVRAYMAARSA